jgi:hypothetical protein
MHRTARPLLVALSSILAAVAFLSGCVARDAGYEDVRKVVASRTGHEVRWGHLEGDSATQGAVRDLLEGP